MRRWRAAAVRAGAMLVFAAAPATAPGGDADRLPANSNQRDWGMRAGPQEDWRSAETIPDLDLDPLAPDQRRALVRYLREECCTCGCTMAIAECHFVMRACPGAARQARAALAAVLAGTSAEHLAAVVALDARGPGWQDAGPGRLGERQALPPGGLALAGRAEAPVTITHYGDLRDPGYGQATGLLRIALAEHPRDVRTVLRFVPDNADPRSWLAAEAVHAAAARGKLVEMHERLGRDAEEISLRRVLEWADELGLDRERLARSLESGEFREAVWRDAEGAQRLGVTRAPALFVNGRRYTGSPAWTDFGPALATELAAVAPSAALAR